MAVPLGNITRLVHEDNGEQSNVLPPTINSTGQLVVVCGKQINARNGTEQEGNGKLEGQQGKAHGACVTPVNLGCGRQPFSYRL